MPVESHGRLFICNCCRCQVVICRPCDRGNIYCSDCSTIARAELGRAASKRYQNTRRGKHMHAERQKRYRERQKKIVTHVGSNDPPPYDLLFDKPSEQEAMKLQPVDNALCCNFCGNSCSQYLRLGFLHRYSLGEKLFSSWLFGP